MVEEQAKPRAMASQKPGARLWPEPRLEIRKRNSCQSPRAAVIANLRCFLDFYQHIHRGWGADADALLRPGDAEAEQPDASPSGSTESVNDRCDTCIRTGARARESGAHLPHKTNQYSQGGAACACSSAWASLIFAQMRPFPAETMSAEPAQRPRADTYRPTPRRVPHEVPSAS